MRAAIHFHSDGYVLDGNQIMGRRAAGAAFLRAAVENAGGEPLIAYVDTEADARGFAQVVRSLDPAVATQCLAKGSLEQLAQVGCLYRADPVMGPGARLRLRSGIARYSLCGITHTLLSWGTLDAIGAALIEPVADWDALICTSSAAVQVVTSTFDQTADYLRWRNGASAPPPRPQLPMIPLGVHSDDWAPSEAARTEARQRLGIGEEEVAVLFAGRLSFAAKAHPFQMYEALREVAGRTGRTLTLVLAGQFFNEMIEGDFRDAAALACPNVRLLHVDGDDADRYAAAFAGSDIFLSLSDSLQETFGITPLEAMAAGLPVVVSDWNGYRDTVRNGIDGFRIPTWAPSPGAVSRLAALYEIGDDYDVHSSRTSTLVSVDMAQLVQRLCQLVGNPELRRDMGEAGRLRARQDFDWRVIYPRYRELWTELAARRASALANPDERDWIDRAPRGHFAHDDPFRRFASYATRNVSATTLVRAVPGADGARYAELTARAMLSFWRMPPKLADAILAAAATPVPIEEVARRVGATSDQMIEQISRLAKMNLVVLKNPD